MRPAARRRARRPGPLGRRAGLPAVDRHRRLPGGGGGLDGPPPRRHRRPRHRWRPASAPRSWWPACRSGCGCAGPTSTPCCTRPSATRPTRWAPRWPAAGPCLSPSTTLARSTRPPSTRRRRAGPVPVGQRAGQPDRRASTTWARRRRGAGAHGVPVLSDECYVEFTWDGRPTRSSSTAPTACWPCTRCRSARTWPALRAGFYAGDPELVHYLSEVRKHAGFMVPGPVQAAAVAAWGDDAHVDEQRGRYLAPPRRDARRPRVPRRRGRPARRRVLPLGAGPRRRRLGPGPTAGRAGRRPRVARASSTARPAPSTCGWPWCNPTTASPW